MSSPLHCQQFGRTTVHVVIGFRLLFQFMVYYYVDASELHYKVEEELPVGTVIGNVVVDAEVGQGLPVEERRGLRFKFLTSPHINVTVDELNGDLVTSGRVDREVLCRELDQPCLIRQSVAVHPIQYFRIVKVAFTVIDINDNSPEFQPNRMVHEVIESTPVESSFVVPTARDSDTAPNSIERYELIDPERIFQLNVTHKLDGSQEVRLVLVRPLDRETKEEHRVTVVAHDAGRPSRSGSVNVTIVVLDSNDNVPVFEYGSYEVTIAENQPLGTTVVKVTAHDKDIGLNAQVLYFLSASSQASFGRVFAVNNVTGEIYVVGTVDYERTPVYHLIVSAIDRGPDAVPSETTVVVRVEDANDNHPKITVNTLVASGTNVSDVLENAPVGTFVGHVIVHDPDTGANGQFNCSSSNQQHFRLQGFANGEYHVITATSLDYERKRRYVIVISCSDDGSPPLASSTELTVNVADVNDNAPRCSPEVYESEILENNYNGVVILQLNCTDLDSPPNSVRSYEISPKESRANFAVARDTGIVSATSSLNREATDRHQFLVLAIDGGSPSRTGTATVVVTVTDVNDERPVFSQDSYAFEVEENQAQGSVVGALSAHDRDAPPFNDFTFVLVPSGSLSDAFTVNGISGRITTTRILDREEQDVYHMKAIVTDSHGPAMTSSADVTVIVLDTNDHSPRFIFPTPGNNTVQVTGDALEGQTLGRIVAKDDDDRLNGEVTYSIVKGNDLDVFRIDHVTGYLKANVDIETVTNKTFSLVICATDRAAEPSRSFAYLNVLINHGTRRDGFQAFVSFDRSNLVPILVVCGVSAVVISVLLVAIFIVVCQQRTRSKDAGRKYNCRTETLKAMGAQGGPDVDGLATEVTCKELGQRVGGSDVAESQGMGGSAIEVRVEKGKPVSRCVGSLGVESLKPPEYYERTRMRVCDGDLAEVSSADSGRASNFNEETQDNLSATLLLPGRSAVSSTMARKNSGLYTPLQYPSSTSSLPRSTSTTLTSNYANVSSFKKNRTAVNGQNSFANELTSTNGTAYEIETADQRFYPAASDAVRSHTLGRNNGYMTVSGGQGNVAGGMMGQVDSERQSRTYTS